MDPKYYLDANASVPLHAAASEALMEAISHTGNPSSPHGMGRKVRQLLDGARMALASALGGREKDIVFTSGASEGNRWLVSSLAMLAAQRNGDLRVVSTKIEHPSLAKPLAAAAAREEFHLDFIPIDRQGHWDLNAVALAKADVLITTAAHNETGLLAPLAELEQRIGPQTIWCLDAAQSFAREKIPPARADFVVVSGHKVGAPAGCGAILLRNQAKTLPVPFLGGGQETGLRPGTEAWVLHHTFGAVCAQIDEIREENQLLRGFRDQVEHRLTHSWHGAEVLFGERPRLPNTSAITLPGVNGEALRMAIDVSGVCVGFGAACSALAPEPSPALLSLGLTPQEARATLRISLPPGIQADPLDQALTHLQKVGERLLQK